MKNLRSVENFPHRCPISPPSAAAHHLPDNLTWDGLMQHRTAIAQYWHRRHRWQYPLEEYLSAGNGALTEAVTGFDPTRGVPLQRHVTALLHLRLRSVRVQQHGHGNTVHDDGQPFTHGGPQYVPHPQGPQLLMTLPASTTTGDDAVFLQEVVTYLTTTVPAHTLRYFLDTIHGDSAHRIAEHYGVPKRRVELANWRIRQALRQWAGMRRARRGSPSHQRNQDADD